MERTPTEWDVPSEYITFDVDGPGYPDLPWYTLLTSLHSPGPIVRRIPRTYERSPDSSSLTVFRSPALCLRPSSGKRRPSRRWLRHRLLCTFTSTPTCALRFDTVRFIQRWVRSPRGLGIGERCVNLTLVLHLVLTFECSFIHPSPPCFKMLRI